MRCFSCSLLQNSAYRYIYKLHVFWWSCSHIFGSLSCTLGIDSALKKSKMQPTLLTLTHTHTHTHIQHPTARHPHTPKSIKASEQWWANEIQRPCALLISASITVDGWPAGWSHCTHLSSLWCSHTVTPCWSLPQSSLATAETNKSRVRIQCISLLTIFKSQQNT